MKPVEIKKDIYRTAVLHPDLRLFDILFPTEKGTTYNSYLIRGERIEKGERNGKMEMRNLSVRL